MAKAKAIDQTPLLEWLVGGLGALIFCALIGVLVWNSGDGAQAPPDVRVDVERIQRTRAGYVLEFAAGNAGDVTAAQVEIVARLASGEERRARLDYLPPHSTRRGGFFFESDPRGAEIRAEGYADP